MKQNNVYVIDTSVLLYDKNCLHNFTDSIVFIPLVVLEELDRFKDRQGVLGESARHINRMLDSLREFGSLHEGVLLEEDNILIKVWVEENKVNNAFLEMSKSNDNYIISSVIGISEKYPEYEVKLITKDINLRVKCDSIKLIAEDYFGDLLDIRKEELFCEWKTIDRSQDFVDDLYKNGTIEMEMNLFENEPFLLRNFQNTSSALCVYEKSSIRVIKSKSEIKNYTSITPKNKEQQFSLDAIINPDVSLVSLTGLPGSGKTYLSLMSGLALVNKDIFKRIIFTRVTQPVGKDLGFLPGDLNEKMQPWIAPIIDNFRNAFGDLSYFNMMLEKNQIDAAPISYMRGRSFNDSFIIVDEAQNATIHELKTIITRVGQNSKILLLGDVDQIDAPYLDKESNGLTQVIQKLKDSVYSVHVNLPKGYRSDLASEAAEKL